MAESGAVTGWLWRRELSRLFVLVKVALGSWVLLVCDASVIVGCGFRVWLVLPMLVLGLITAISVGLLWVGWGRFEANARLRLEEFFREIRERFEALDPRRFDPEVGDGFAERSTPAPGGCAVRGEG